MGYSKEMYILEEGYSRENSRFFVFHYLKPIATVDEYSNLKVYVDDKTYNFILETCNEGEGYVYASNCNAPIMCRPIYELLSRGFYPIKVTAPEIKCDSTKYFTVTKDMSYDEILNKFKEIICK